MFMHRKPQHESYQRSVRLQLLEVLGIGEPKAL